jgi:hypothetical protein
VEDAERFLTWLQGQGLGEKQLAAYRKYLEELAKHPSLSAALRAAEDAGVPAREIGNMRAVAARFAEFQATGEATASAAPPSRRSPTSPPPSARPPTSPPLEIEKPARPAPARDHSVELPRKGCVCNRRQDVYVDNDFGALAKLLGGGAGIGAVLLTRMIGVFGALALAFGLAAMGGMATIISICLRCNSCRRRVTDLDSDERAAVHKGRGLVTLVTLGLVAATAVSGFLWWKRAQARYHQNVDVHFELEQH